MPLSDIVFVKSDQLIIDKQIKVVEGETQGFDIDFETREYLGKNQIENFVFNHGLGHGIGINVHEAPPSLSYNDIAKKNLKNNMTFTIEPGLYNPKYFGIRLENSCFIKDNKICSFTKIGFESKLIDKKLLNTQELSWLKDFELL